MELNVACCLCVRNCYQYLPKIFDNLFFLRKEFKNFCAVFVYDNCNDGSERLLKEYQKRATHPVVIIHNKNNKSPYRTVRIANARNKYLRVVYEYLTNVDFHIVIDADDVNCGRWNVDLIKRYINEDSWDALSFNRSPYYDIWALIYDKYRHHCWGYRPNPDCQIIVNHMMQDIQNKLRNTNPNHLLECLSAFNGFAIYRTNKFKNIYYDGVYNNIKHLISDNERNETLETLNQIFNRRFAIDENYVEHCEHIFYHISAIKNNNARIRISPHSL